MDSLKQEAATVGIARLLAIHQDGSGLVLREGESEPFVCDRVQTSDRDSLTLYPDDTVVVTIPVASDERGVILGRIGSARAPVTASRDHEHTAPDELLIEARHSLTLRVGSGSITIREDGKILIKGKDLVSHATRLNRIKGGAVQIN